jgi:RNA polymerase sigma-70 factor (ECF subfamily)
MRDERTSHTGQRQADGEQSVDPFAWVDAHGDALFRYALARVRRTDVAEDLVQETFVAALRALDQFEGRSTVRTWLVGILRRKIVDYVRHDVRRRPFEAEAADPVIDRSFDGRGVWKRVRRWGGDPSKLLEREEFVAVLRACLDAMPRTLSRVFCLREMDQQPSEQVCKELGISPANLWTRLYRARLRLRQCLEDGWFGTDEDRM